MIHSARQNPKFMRLVRKIRPMLGETPIVDADTVATGILERLWHATITGARRGDIGKYSNEVIAEMCGWFGDADELVSSLVEIGWLDPCSTHRLIVHDWNKHAPKHVKGNVSKEGGFFIAKIREPLGPSLSDEISVSTEPLGLNEVPEISVKEGPPNPTKRNVTQPNQTVLGEITPRVFFDRWNSIAGEKRLSVSRRLTEGRKDKIKTRINQDGWFDDFLAACDKLPLPGDGWQPDIDWIIANDSNVAKILEGKYDWRATVGGNGSAKPKMTEEERRRNSVPTDEDLRNWRP